MVDAQLLKLLAQRYFQQTRVSEFWKSWMLCHRAAYVREATRFKTMHDTVDVPARDQEVIDGAEANATAVHLPKTIAKAVFSAIINSSIPFEYCVVSSLC
jgi:chorismate mutase